MTSRQRYEVLQVHLAKVKAAPRAKLYTAIPGVREAVELVELAELLLGEMVSEIEQLRAERAKE